jgi:hypothetical protein
MTEKNNIKPTTLNDNNWQKASHQILKCGLKLNRAISKRQNRCLNHPNSCCSLAKSHGVMFPSRPQREISGGDSFRPSPKIQAVVNLDHPILWVEDKKYGTFNVQHGQYGETKKVATWISMLAKTRPSNSRVCMWEVSLSVVRVTNPKSWVILV